MYLVSVCLRHPLVAPPRLISHAFTKTKRALPPGPSHAFLSCTALHNALPGRGGRARASFFYLLPPAASLRGVPSLERWAGARRFWPSSSLLSSPICGVRGSRRRPSLAPPSLARSLVGCLCWSASLPVTFSRVMLDLDPFFFQLRFLLVILVHY